MGQTCTWGQEYCGALQSVSCLATPLYSTPLQITLLQWRGPEELLQRAGSTIRYVRRWKEVCPILLPADTQTWLSGSSLSLLFFPCTRPHKVTLQTSQEYTRRMPQRASKSWTFSTPYPEFTVKLGPDPWEGHTLPSCFLCNCVFVFDM